MLSRPVGPDLTLSHACSGCPVWKPVVWGSPARTRLEGSWYMHVAHVACFLVLAKGFAHEHADENASLCGFARALDFCHALSLAMFFPYVAVRRV